MKTFNKNFASDNNSGVHPDIFKVLESVNIGYEQAYGDDPYTQKANNTFKKFFGEHTETYFVYNGTGANVLALKCLTDSFNSVLCSDESHIYQDECNAVENILGIRLNIIKTDDAKLTVKNIEPYLHHFGVEHRSQPKVISITQSTEYGTLYSLEELSELVKLKEKYNLYIHMDGARIANAVVALNTDFETITKGVDILSFGGTKNGLMHGEALVFFNKELAKNFKYYRKQTTQLSSKMRYTSAQFEYLLSSGLWKTNATNANNMAKYLEKNLLKLNEETKKIEITQKREVNSVFAIINDKKAIKKIQNEVFFYDWNESRNEVRLMTCYDTTKEDVDHLINVMRKYL